MNILQRFRHLRERKKLSLPNKCSAQGCGQPAWTIGLWIISTNETTKLSEVSLVAACIEHVYVLHNILADIKKIGREIKKEAAE